MSIVKMGWGTNKNPIEQVAFYLPVKGSGNCNGNGMSPIGSQASFSDLNADGIDKSRSRVSLGGIGNQEDVTIGVVSQETLSRLLPTEYEEKYVRVFARHKAQKGAIAAIFKRWIQAEMGKDAVAEPLSPIRKRKADEM